jgi:hypothetical protein
MSSTQLRSPDRTRPFVAVVCDVPLLGEAMRAALEFADVETFAAAGGDLDGLLRWLRPSALIVDSRDRADEAAAYAREHDLPVLHVSVYDGELRFYHAGVWEQVSSSDRPTVESIRNVVAGAIFGGEVRRR